ncbi:NUDIX domain-containing protein [Glaciihabitans sp. UYNi722]|uniref:NUDIX hydrolase n=1 Tax=Glaciihabitans sp. UYNi722 TaxID=3156344 RepID=UPI0033966181
MIVDNVLTSLEALPVSQTRESYLSFVATGGAAALQRDGGPEHVTASCFAFSPDFDRVLLCFHRKGGFWVQFGGHIESHDTSIASAAIREAREESGITELSLLSGSIADLDRHNLQSGFSCTAHWDVGFVAIAATDAQVAVSDESEDVRWFPCQALPTTVPPGLRERLDKVLDVIPTLVR